MPDGCFVSDEIIKTIFRTACRKSKKKMEDGESSDKESRSKDGRSVSRPKAKGKTEPKATGGKRAQSAGEEGLKPNAKPRQHQGRDRQTS